MFYRKRPSIQRAVFLSSGSFIPSRYANGHFATVFSPYKLDLAASCLRSARRLGVINVAGRKCCNVAGSKCCTTESTNPIFPTIALVVAADPRIACRDTLKLAGPMTRTSRAKFDAPRGTPK